jgi:hypothetical protein
MLVMGSSRVDCSRQIVKPANLTSCLPGGREGIALTYFAPSEMQSEKARNHSDHNDDADNVKDIHCFDPIDRALITRGRKMILRPDECRIGT